MVINQIFYSLQGEGFLAGVPSVFIRMAGCPLRCRWCDTKYAWDTTAGKNYSIEDIVRTVGQWPSKFVIITGGEPMINHHLPELTRQLKSCDKHITIETAGIVFVPAIACDLMSISPKLSNSAPVDAELDAAHERNRLNISTLTELIDNYQYQLKFVVESARDLPEIQKTIEKIGNVDSAKVMLMPQAVTKEKFLTTAPMVADMCKRSGFAFGQRLQVLLWNNEIGT